MSASASGAAIRTEGLTKHFGDITALDGLDLTVERGEVLGFLGPNGSGKTTTIRLLLDFLRPDAGRSEVLGGAGADPEVRRRIGYLPADLHLDPNHRGVDVFELFGRLRGVPDHGRLAGLVDRFDLDPSRPIGELSTGNRRKLGIIAAFAHAPDLLLLDEPSSGLDPLLQNQFHQLVAESVDEGATVFLSSHALAEVEALATRVGILRQGQLATVSTIDDLRRQARQRIDLHLADSGRDIAVEALTAVAGVVEATASLGVLHLVVEGSVDAALKAATRFDVQRIVTHDTDLEDIFLRYYATESDG